MVAAALAKEAGREVHALTIDYGQRHRREIEAARGVARTLGLASHSEIALDLRQFGGSALTADIDVPKSGVGEDIPVTYVPARNLVFLSLTTAFAESIGAGRITIGVNALDYSGYPDCRPEFIAAFAEAARLGTKAGVGGEGFAIDTPLQFMTKADIARECHRLGLDPTPAGLACGACDSCRLRRKGFAEAELVDTTPYSEENT